jgi:hypothetical protein
MVRLPCKGPPSVALELPSLPQRKFSLTIVSPSCTVEAATVANARPCITLSIALFAFPVLPFSLQPFVALAPLSPFYRQQRMLMPSYIVIEATNVISVQETSLFQPLLIAPCAPCVLMCSVRH